MARKVTLVLLDADGEPLGALPPFTVEVPWWPEVGEIVEAARALWNIDVVVLRIIGPPDRPGPPGGEVTYVAEVGPSAPLPALVPVDQQAAFAPHPNRAAWASPGGPAATTAWASAVLEARGVTPTAFVQRKSWNLSAIWRVDTGDSPLWLKQLPTFFAHEPVLLRWLGSVAPGVATELVAGEGARALLAHAPGEDQFGASAEALRPMLADLHRIQAYAADRIGEVFGLGVPDRRRHVALPAIQAVAARYGPTLEPRFRSSLEKLVEDLPERFADVAACGVPDTLVHGDFQGGNVRADGERRVIIDWGDSTIGDPTMDIARAVDGLRDADRDALVREWAARWRAHTPGCDPERALQLMLPVVDLLYAVVYMGFLDQIEPSEWPYHRDDPPACLRAAVRRAGLLVS